MAAEFNGTNWLSLTGVVQPVIYPYTMGCWVMPYDANQWTVMCNANAAGSQFMDHGTGGGNWLHADQGTDGVNTQTGYGDTNHTNVWCFLLSRIISATNRRYMSMNGENVVSISDVVLSKPLTASGMSVFYLGGFNAPEFIGRIAEFWHADIDAWPIAAGDMPADQLRYMAYNGPWAWPRVANNIRVYHSLKNSLSGGDSNANIDQVFNLNQRPVWVNNNGVALNDHPPLVPGYKRPFDRVIRGMF